jgi:hypothetical protein
MLLAHEGIVSNAATSALPARVAPAWKNTFAKDTARYLKET